jgi:hypothetical protein
MLTVIAGGQSVVTENNKKFSDSVGVDHSRARLGS